MYSLEAGCFQQAGRPGIWSPGWAGLTFWLAQLAEAGLVVVPTPGIPSLVPGRLHGGEGRWGVALGRTSCLETCRKGKPRCHLPSDQEAGFLPFSSHRSLGSCFSVRELGVQTAWARGWGRMESCHPSERVLFVPCRSV